MLRILVLSLDWGELCSLFVVPLNRSALAKATSADATAAMHSINIVWDIGVNSCREICFKLFF